MPATQQTQNGKKNWEFAVSILCVVFGLILRIIYIIVYSVQPRDAFSYVTSIESYNKNGMIDIHFAKTPLSLWIFAKISSCFDIASEKGCVIVNMIAGLALIYITTRTVAKHTESKMVAAAIGLLTASQPKLIAFSCTILRENLYLLFALLSCILLIEFSSKITLGLCVLSSFLAALAFLCKLEALELIIVFGMVLLYCGTKKNPQKLKSMFLNSTAYLSTFIITVACANRILGVNNITIDRILKYFTD